MSYEEYTNTGVIEAPIKSEIIGQTVYYNLSDQPLEKVRSWLPKNMTGIEKAVALPDGSEGKAGLPTGFSVTVDMLKRPDWREMAISDVGCGMQVVGTAMTWDEFDENKGLWDETYKRLKSNKGGLGDLGRGNHFLDAAVDGKGNVSFVFHTGSRDESEKATNLVDKPQEFDTEYERIKRWARDNRMAIGLVLSDIYGKWKPKMLLDQVHNFYEIDKKANKATIYKGAVKLMPGALTIIPANMDDRMALVRGTPALEKINFAMSHGTGRPMKRGEAKDLADKLGDDYYEYLRGNRERGTQGKLYIPWEIGNESLRSELPLGYRGLDDCLKRIGGLVTVDDYLVPIAYIGQI